MVGQTVSHYRILEKLGGGGMGVVYRAHDERLDRDVALKVLPPERVADPDRKRRFIQEARAASALNHPNIITIYDIDEADGVHFIAMEYVRGKTLDRLIARHGLSLNEALKCAVQIAAALAKAHSAGIVHRDLKPANVMVTDDGLVKVLDFGLAKLTEAAPAGDAETVATRAPVTEEGTIVGTVGYMSPEQAEGKPVDARSDIFSFGSVLYEMLTGQRAFQGETEASTLAAILKEEPKPLSQVAASLPHEVERLVKRCLRKDPAHRFQHMDDLKVALEELKEESDSGELAEPVGASLGPGPGGRPQGAPLRKWRTVTLTAAMGVVAAGAVLWLFLRTPPAPKVLGIHQITHTGHLKGYRLATDGARVYFSEWVEGHGVLMTVAAAGGDAVAIPTSLRDAWVRGLAPDGSELTVISRPSDRWEFEVWRVPVPGGSPRRVGNLVASDLCDTPDGRGILHVEGRDVYLANADGAGSRKLLSAPGDVSGFGCASDGSRLRFTVGGLQQLWRGSIWEASADGSNLHRFLPDWNAGGSEFGGTWTPDSKYYVFGADVRGDSNLWAFREAGIFRKRGGEPVQLTVGPMQVSPCAPLVSKDGKKIFFVATQGSPELSVYDSRFHEFVPYLGGISAEGVSFSKDAQWVAYVRLPEGTLWRMKMDGSDQLQLTFPPMKVSLPRWSPDGKRLAFSDWPPLGHPKIYTISADGGTPEAQTSGEAAAHDPTWSLDGNALMFDYSGNLPDSSIHVLNLNTHAIAELPGSKGLYSPRWSPDGRYAAALASEDGTLMLFEFKTQKWQKLTEAGAGSPNWSREGKYVFFVNSLGGTRFYRVEIATRKTEEVARFPEARLASGIRLPWVGMTPDGSPLVARGAGAEEIYALDVDFP